MHEYVKMSCLVLAVREHLGVNAFIKQFRIISHLLLRQWLEPGIVFFQKRSRSPAPEHLISEALSLAFGFNFVLKYLNICASMHRCDYFSYCDSWKLGPSEFRQAFKVKVGIVFCCLTILEKSKSQHAAEVKFATQPTAHPVVFLRRANSRQSRVWGCSKQCKAYELAVDRCDDSPWPQLRTRAVDRARDPPAAAVCDLCNYVLWVDEHLVILRNRRTETFACQPHKTLSCSLSLTQHCLGPWLRQQLLRVGRRDPLGRRRRHLMHNALLEQFVEY